MKKAFFFDRDGTINEPVYKFDKEHKKMMDCAAVKLSELKINENAKKVIDHIKTLDFIPIVITNQPDFLKYNLPLKDYEEITSKICSELGLQRAQVFECLHKEGFSLPCNCRKPLPGLFLMAKGMFKLDLKNSWLVGDSWKDIQAAELAGVKNTIFLEEKKEEGKAEGNEESIEKMNSMNLKPRYIIKEISEVISILKNQNIQE